jgi:hypothetical protein
VKNAVKLHTLMKCYYHHDRDAVGTCKSCQKGLCQECAVDLTQGLACKGHCEEDVKGLIQLIQTNIKLSATSHSLIRSSRKVGLMGAGFYVLLGLMFVGWGFHDGLSFFIAMGVCFVIYGTINLIRVLRLATVNSNAGS